MESGTESWWIDRKKSAFARFAAATRVSRLGLALPPVTRSLVSANPSDLNFSSIRFASCKLKSNSGMLRALVAPSDSLVWPTSRMIRNFDGSHFKTTREAWGFGAASSLGATFAVCRDQQISAAPIDSSASAGIRAATRSMTTSCYLFWPRFTQAWRGREYSPMRSECGRLRRPFALHGHAGACAGVRPVVPHRAMLGAAVIPECDRVLAPAEAALEQRIFRVLVEIGEDRIAFVSGDSDDVAREAAVDIEC